MPSTARSGGLARRGWRLRARRGHVSGAAASPPTGPGPSSLSLPPFFVFFQAEDGIGVASVTGVQTCALPIYTCPPSPREAAGFTEDGRASRHPAEADAATVPQHTRLQKHSVRVTTARGGRRRQQAKSQMGVTRGLARDKQTAIGCDVGQALTVVLD